MSQEKWLTPEDRAKRIAVGATVAGVLLVLFLFVVIIIQLVQIGYKNAEIARIESEIERFEQLADQLEKDRDYFESELGMYHEALEQGWKTP
ncbi:MAG: hypothetical protein IKD43_04630 [Clostridia bacterium]|nr:hypothetical protein [Clostridia bacterium]